MHFATTDLCDANEHRIADGTLAVLPPVFTAFGKRAAFAGPARTIRVFEDNVLVRQALEQPGEGSVLVVDGGGSLRCALVGGNLGTLAQTNDWAGIVVYGCIRDVAEINDCEIGVRALGVHPQRSNRKGAGEVDCRIMVAGVAVKPGNWVYADTDGMLIAQGRL